MSDKMSEIYNRACEAGLKAVSELTVEPMYVKSGGKTYKIDDGVCGFAEIMVKPANCAFAKWLRSNKIAEKLYTEPGVSIWVGEFDQSYDKKRTYAAAFAEVLRGEGMNAWSKSRMD